MLRSTVLLTLCEVVPPPNYLPPRSKLIEVWARKGSPVGQNTILTLTFDHPVIFVAGATGSETTWKLPVAHAMHITWRNEDNSAAGPSYLNYAIRIRPPPDNTPPKLNGGNLTHGAFNVNPDLFNRDRIEVTFNVDVTGSTS